MKRKLRAPWSIVLLKLCFASAFPLLGQDYFYESDYGDYNYDSQYYDSSYDDYSSYEDYSSTGYYEDTYSDDDGDGLMNYEEVSYGTDSSQWDSDFDGLSDYEEIYGVTATETHIEYHYADDGFGNYTEYSYESSYPIDTYPSPTNPDSDGDGIPDGWEVHFGTSPDNASDAYSLSFTGLTFFLEYISGEVMSYDSDRDGVQDAAEINTATNPHDPQDYVVISEVVSDEEEDAASGGEAGATGVSGGDGTMVSDGDNGGATTSDGQSSEGGGAETGSTGGDTEASESELVLADLSLIHI